MGILEFFGTLIKNDITSNSIKNNYKEKMDVNHLLIDFNSIIHVSSQKIINDINTLLKDVLKNIYDNRNLNFFLDRFNKYKLEINVSDPIEIIKIFHSHFNEKYLDKLIIADVINSILFIIKTYCHNETIKTLLLAIDGVPSKSKMIEQKQRRYLSAIVELYKLKLLKKYKEYLKQQTNYIYLATKYNIEWSRNKITPGTEFMDKLVKYLKSVSIQEKIKNNRKNLKIIISSMYEVGEGEKKIVNFVNLKLFNTEDIIMVYSPDADMILLCILLPVKNVYMLRYNQQTLVFDLINIKKLKKNINYYINEKNEYDSERINTDIVIMSTLFGNDFLPKIESINVKKGFQTILDAYLKTLFELNNYLVEGNRLNFIFFKLIIKNLIPEEKDFIKYNDLYNKYLTLGQIKNVFNNRTITSENIVSIFTEFRNEYTKLKQTIINNGNLYYFETHTQFFDSLKKSINLNENLNLLSPKQLINLLKEYYKKNKDFPRLNINLNEKSHSINDPYIKKIIKEKHYNDYEKEVYQFEHMLDNYYIKLNAEPLKLSKKDIQGYYEKYFKITVIKDGKLTEESKKLMEDYVEGMLWVFNYYINDKTYINKWYYKHERTPLLEHILMYLDLIDDEIFNNIFNNLETYQVYDLKDYFNPIEQLIYVSPMTPNVKKLLPENYKKILNDDFFKNYFININEITNKLWKQTISTEVDCHSIPYFNKCLIKPIDKFIEESDKEFLKNIRKRIPSEISKNRSKIVEPKY